MAQNTRFNKGFTGNKKEKAISNDELSVPDG